MDVKYAKIFSNIYTEGTEMMKRSFMWCLAVVAVFVAVSTAFLFGITRNGSLQPKSPEIVSRPQLRILSNWSGSLKKQVLQNALERYREQHGNIEVIDDFVDESFFHIRLTEDFCSGCAPDIVASRLDRSMYSLIAGGSLADLSDVLRDDPEWASDMNKSLLDAATFDGKVYAVPTERSYIFLYINEDIFQKLGVAVPSDLESLKNCVSVFTANGITPFAFSAADNNMYMYQALVASLAGSKQIKHDFDTESIDSSYIKAFDIMRELREMGAFPDDYATTDLYDAYMLFLSKKAAMIVESSDFVSEIYYYSTYETNNPVSKYDFSTINMVLFPIISGNSFRPTAAFPGDCTYFLSKSSYEKQRSASVPLLKYITSKDVSTNMLLSAKADILSKTYPPPTSHSRLFTRRAEVVQLAQEFTLMPDTVLDRRLWQSRIKTSLVPVIEGSADAYSVWANALSAQQSIQRERRNEK